MTKQEMLKALIEDLRLNHEFCPKEIILQAADELEKMQQGIETLHAMYEQAVKQQDYLTALRTALSQLKQEPVAWMSSDRYWMWSDYSKAMAAVANIPTLTLIPLYTTPPAAQRPWQGLTAEDLAQIDTDEFWQVGNHMAIAMAVEDKLKERNT